MEIVKREKKQKQESIVSLVMDFVVTAIIAFIVSWIIIHYITVLAIVPSCSMEKTVMTGSRIFIDKISYKVIDPRRGDIISFDPPDGGDKILLKRIIALPGETIEGKNHEVYIDGQLLKENYIADKIDNEFGPYTVPENSYFVMGDNRLYSLDARYWENKFVARNTILGRAIIEITPELKFFGKEHYNIE